MTASEAGALGPGRQPLLVEHGGLAVPESFDGKEQAQREAPRREHAVEARGIFHASGSVDLVIHSPLALRSTPETA